MNSTKFKMAEHKRAHIVIIAPPFQGHINPSIQLSLNLASRGFTITFVNTHSAHDQITKAQKNQNGPFELARDSGLDIRYATVSDGFPLTFDRSSNREEFLEGRLRLFPKRVDELVSGLAREDPPATCLVADTYSTWGSTVARKHGLVFVSFWTQPALVFTLYYHLHLLKENGHYGRVDNRKDTIDYIPGVDAIEPTELMSYLQETDTSKVTHQSIHMAFEDVKKADFIICNTVKELEPEATSAIQARQPFYTIGPLIFTAGLANRAVSMNLLPGSDCTGWLDGKPQGSVLYASFGSYARTNEKDIREIANGLMLSGVNFIWVLRPGVVCAKVGDFLPNGFQENVRARGLIVPWCDQAAVMKNPAVGGFLTHCGWNSILESIWCCMPLICFPLETDQPTNRRLVVDDWKIGINLCDGESVSSGEVAAKVWSLMNGDDACALREAVVEVRKKLESALKPDGSSVLGFDGFVEDLRSKIELRLSS